MAQIIPIRDLKNTSEILKLVQSTNEPIFVTKNGYGAFMMMNLEAFDKITAKQYVDALLKEAEDDLANGRICDGRDTLKEIFGAESNE